MQFGFQKNVANALISVEDLGQGWPTFYTPSANFSKRE